MDSIRKEMGGFDALEKGRLGESEQVVKANTAKILILTSATSLSTFLLAILFAFYFRQNARQQVRREVYSETRHLLEIQQQLNARLEEANGTLQINEARLAVTLNSIGDAVLTTDAGGNVAILNPLAEKLTGWSRVEARGRPVDEVFRVIHQETRCLAVSPVGATLALGVTHGLVNHTLLVSRDGGECAIADSCAPIRNPGGEVIGAVLVFRDVTAEYAAQAELENAKQMAEKANLAKSDFLSSMSHEIRTPMNAIIGMSYLALKTDMTPRQRDYLRKIKGSGQHLLGIINDILDFSKIEADKLALETTEFELEKVLDNVANLIADKTNAKGLELVFDIDPDVPPLLVGDPLRLGQILINYGNNAVKFTEEGEIAIIIRLHARTDEGTMVYFAVRDTGIGLSAEDIGRLFRRFSQADPSITRRFGGTGLGLAIAKKLADLMGGEVGVVSELGKGSTFWFTAWFPKAVGQPRKLILSSDLNDKRVLVVDDNDYARQVLGNMLTGMSFQVDQAQSGMEALASVAQADHQGRPFELVFLDWQMPGMDGIEAARRLKELPLGHRPILMMVTAYGREEVLGSAEAMGITQVLVKPVSASLLFDGIVGVLGRSGGPGRVIDESTGTFECLAPLKGSRVLLVEDNELNQEVATELLREAGFTVDLAVDGRKGVDMVRSRAYDIVLMDVQMPVMDGLTATRLIRGDESCRDLPVVAMTASAMVGDRECCLAAGMNDHIAKPIEPEDLWKVLLKWITPGRGAPAGRPANPRPGVEPAPELPGIDGLDMATALRRVLGRQPLYLSMLRKFRSGQSATPAGILAALEAGDEKTAERLAHTLKGLSGNIGATRLQHLAEGLESAIRQEEPREALHERLQELEGPLEELMGELDRKLPGEEGRKVLDVDPVRLQAVCALLESLLAEDDGEAVDTLETNADLLSSAFPQHFRQLQGAIRSFDFEAALATLGSASGASR
jgi:PAS domain S-box-containing protein